MPRNAAGTYTLPLPPVVTNTTITSNFENTTDTDIASELTNSLDRNGRGGMLAPFKIFDGTMAAPGLAFTLEPGTGLWRAGVGDMRVAVLGVDYMVFAGTAVTIPVGVSFNGRGTFKLADGAVATPSLAFINEVDSGLYRAGLQDIRLAVGGADKVRFAINSVIFDQTVNVQLNGGRLVFGDIVDGEIVMNTVDGADNRTLFLCGGGAVSSSRGSTLILGGNEAGSFGGLARISSGNSGTANDVVELFTRGDRQVVIGIFPGATRWIQMYGGIARPPYITASVGPLGLQAIAPNVASATFQNGGPNGSFTVWENSAGNALGYVGNAANIMSGSAANFGINAAAGGAILVFGVGDVEKARITTQGYAKFTTINGSYINGLFHEFRTDTANNYILNMHHAGNPPFGLHMEYSFSPNDQGHEFFRGFAAGGTKHIMYANGGYGNFSANNTNLCSLVVKRDWAPYTPAQLEVLSAAVNYMEDGRYKFIDQTHDDWNHGYTAEGVRDAFRDIAPELADEVNWGSDNEKKMLLSVYPTDLTNIRLAVAKYEINKLKAEIETLKARIH